jgi:hypothetical protein
MPVRGTLTNDINTRIGNEKKGTSVPRVDHGKPLMVAQSSRMEADILASDHRQARKSPNASQAGELVDRQ